MSPSEVRAYNILVGILFAGLVGAMVFLGSATTRPSSAVPTSGDAPSTRGGTARSADRT